MFGARLAKPYGCCATTPIDRSGLHAGGCLLTVAGGAPGSTAWCLWPRTTAVTHADPAQSGELHRLIPAVATGAPVQTSAAATPRKILQRVP